MISHNEAQELHRLIGGALQSAEDNQWELIGADDLTRALATGTSRRTALKALAGGAVAGMLTLGLLGRRRP